MFIYIVFLFIVTTYLMICSNPHDYQHCKYNKLYTLSFVPSDFRLKAKYYTAENEQLFQYPYILKPYTCDSFSLGVEKINNAHERDNYLRTFHPEFTMIEEYTDFPNEIGITYLFENRWAQVHMDFSMGMGLGSWNPWVRFPHLLLGSSVGESASGCMALQAVHAAATEAVKEFASAIDEN